MVLRLNLAAALAVVMATASGTASAESYKATVTQYTIQSADIGSCRLKGISTSSDNFKYYASVSSKDASMNEGCARCIKVSKDGAPSLMAYVVDVCQGCKAGELKLSSSGLSALSIDPNTNNATATYKFTNCPSNFVTGSVSACLMEGASNSYIPLQFYNSQKVIQSATISGTNATQSADSFFFSATPPTDKKDTKWFTNVPVSLTSTDGETQTGVFAFDGSTGCAASTFQFSVASTADGNDDESSGSSSAAGGDKNGFLVPLLVGVVCAVLLIVGSIFFVRRRRASKFDGDRRADDMDNQYLSPTVKGQQYSHSPDRPTYAIDNSLHNSTSDPSEPNSPTMDFDEAASPAAIATANQGVFETISHQQVQDQQQNHQQTAGAPKVAYFSYVAPQTFSYSKPVTNERLTSNNSFRGSARTAPTFSAPVLPSRVHEESDSDSDQDRSSFDVDDMRETEVIRERERLSSMGGDLQSSVAPYSSESAYASASVTSPQSYVRATSLRRNSTQVASDRPALRFTSSMPAEEPSSEERRSDSFGFSDRDSYASDTQGTGTANPGTGSFRDSSSGYSRESLGILGYPYAKKPSGGRSSVTGKKTVRS